MQTGPQDEPMTGQNPTVEANGYIMRWEPMDPYLHDRLSLGAGQGDRISTPNATTTNDLGECPDENDGCPSVQWGVA